jgi:hypothetical protein
MLLSTAEVASNTVIKNVIPVRVLGYFVEVSGIALKNTKVWERR